MDDALKQFKALAREPDSTGLQRKFLEMLLSLYGFERGSIWIKKDDGFLCVESAGLHGESIKGVSIDKGQPSIVGWVIINGRMTMADPRTDKRHFKAFEEKLVVKSQLILCFPLSFKGGGVYGAVQIIDTAKQVAVNDLGKKSLERIQNLVDTIAAPLSNVLLLNRQRQEAAGLKKVLAQIRQSGLLIGRSPAFEKVRDKIDSYAPTDYPVLVTGASGTGKELVAQALHNAGPRQKKPFLVQNCSAIPETLLESELFGYKKGAFSGATKDKKGLFEAAHGGSVFLDEIGDMPLNLQARILRVVQSNEIKPVGATESIEVDVRIIAATNRNISRMVAASEFRQDLYYRLAVLPLHLPSLGARHEDIPLLFRHFMTREALKMDVPAKQMLPEAMDRLMNYHFPGNIRELENLVRYLLVMAPGESVAINDLPVQFQGTKPVAPASKKKFLIDTDTVFQNFQSSAFDQTAFGGRSWNEVEQAYVKYLLEKNNWHVTNAATAAGVKRSTFVSRMQRLGINRQPVSF